MTSTCSVDFAPLCIALGHELALPSIAPPGQPYLPFRVGTDLLCDLTQFPSLSFSLPPIAHCVHSALLLAHFAVNSHVVPTSLMPRPRLNLHQFRDYIDQIGLRVPIYYYEVNGQINIYHGVSRPDHFAFLFFPPLAVASILAHIPPARRPPPGQAHIAFVIFSDSVKHFPSPWYILFSNTPPFQTDHVFWHAPALTDTTLFENSCTCTFSPCPHDAHLDAPVVDFVGNKPFSLSLDLDASFETTPTQLVVDRRRNFVDHHTPLLHFQLHDTWTVFRHTFSFTPPARPSPAVFRGQPVWITQNTRSDLRYAPFSFALGYTVTSLLGSAFHHLRNTSIALKHVAQGLADVSQQGASLVEEINNEVCSIVWNNDLPLPDNLFLPEVGTGVSYTTVEFCSGVSNLVVQLGSYCLAAYSRFADECTRCVAQLVTEVADHPLTGLVSRTFTTPLTRTQRCVSFLSRCGQQVVDYMCLARVGFVDWRVGLLAVGVGVGCAYLGLTYRHYPSTNNVSSALHNPNYSFWRTPLGRAIERKLVGHSDSNRAEIRLIARRTIQEMSYPSTYDVQCLDDWLATIAAPVAVTIPAIPAGLCFNCLNSRKVKRCICKQCKQALKFPFYHQPIAHTVQHVGFRPIHPVDPLPPSGSQLDADVEIRFMGRPVTDFDQLMFLYHRFKPPPRGYGHSCGFVFAGIEPTVYSPHPVTALVALCCRMGVSPPFLPMQGAWTLGALLFRSLFPHFLTTLDPWSEEDVISHLPTAKARLMIETQRQYNQGLCPPRRKLIRFGCFSKMEKAVVEYTTILGDSMSKLKRVPRLINNPSPFLNFLEAPFSLPFSKHFGAHFSYESRILYAPGCKPWQINRFFQSAWAYSHKIIEDDVSFMDLSQSKDSLYFVMELILQCFPSMPRHVRDLFVSTVHLTIKTPEIAADLGYHNASGVPTTSISNSVVCLLARLIAIAHAILDVPFAATSLSRYIICIQEQVLPNIYMAVSGDDGYLVVNDDSWPRKYDDPVFLDLYSAGFATMGLDVGRAKIRVFGDHNWRLSTFLAMRPYRVADGTYELGPELARRLMTAFWRIKTTVHPVAWLRGICQSMLTAFPFVPILTDICERVMEITTGPAYHDVEAAPVDLSDPYSIVYSWESMAQLNPVCIMEMAADYSFSQEDYMFFRNQLAQIHDPFVSFDCPLFHYILAQQ